MSLVNSWEMKLFVAPENAFDTGPGTGATAGIFAAGDAVLNTDFNPGPEQKQRTRHRKDSTGFRSQSVAMVHGAMDPVDAELTASLAPSGTAGTAPDTDALLENAFGLGTNTPATSEVYTIASDPSDSLAFMFADPGKSIVYYLFGAVVSQRKISFNEEEPMDAFSIQAARRASIQETTLDAALDASETGVTFNNPERLVNAHGCVVIVGTEEILLSADPDDFNYSTGVVINCTRGHNSTTPAIHSDDDPIYPSVPASSTTVGVPIGEHKITASFGGVSWSVVGGEIVFDTGRGFRPMERDSKWVQGLVNRRLSVTASLEGVLDIGTDADLLGKAVQNTSGAVSVAIGNVAGNILTAALADAEIMVGTPTFSEEDPMAATIEFTGQGSSGNDDYAETYT